VSYYETIFIAHPNLEDAGITKLVDETKKMVANRGGELVYEEVMGKKRLAYMIEKQRFGTYVLLQFKGDAIDHPRLSRDLEIKDEVLAHMMVSIDADEVREVREEPAPPVVREKSDSARVAEGDNPSPEDSPSPEAEASAEAETEAEIKAETEADEESETVDSEPEESEDSAAEDKGDPDAEEEAEVSEQAGETEETDS
jgi:small subunit ribosomal protein S6